MTPGAEQDTIAKMRHVFSRLTLLTALSTTVGACAPAATLNRPTFHDLNSLRSEVNDWRGPRTGVAYLRRSVQARVDARTDPSLALSRLRVHHVRVNWEAPGDAEITIPAPANGRLVSVNARVLTKQGPQPIRPIGRGSVQTGVRPDPDQARWTLRFADVPAGAPLEVIADFELPGTLTTDARWLGAADGPTGQLLIRYDVPTSVSATMQLRGASGSPLVTSQDGQQVFALFLSDVPARGDAGAHVRYVARSASVKGHDQRFATSWAHVGAPYAAELLGRATELRANHREPYRPTQPGVSGAREACLWVRDRIQRDDAMDALWHQGRPLPMLVTTNDLNATDKVHLLHWLLDAAGIAHEIAAVRSITYAGMDPALPIPGAFDGAAVYVPSENLWLDPACKTCAPGEVRLSYRGALGLVLPPSAGATLVTLPK